jgi:hypothetical protein
MSNCKSDALVSFYFAVIAAFKIMRIAIFVNLFRLLEPRHHNYATAGAGLRSCPAAWRCHMTAGGGSQNTTTGSCWQSSSLSSRCCFRSIIHTFVVQPFPPFLLYVHARYNSLCHPPSLVIHLAIRQKPPFFCRVCYKPRKKIGRQASGVDLWAVVLLGLNNTKIFAIRNLSGKYAALKLLIISFINTQYKSFPHAFKRPIGILFSLNAFQGLIERNISSVSSFITRVGIVNWLLKSCVAVSNAA